MIKLTPDQQAVIFSMYLTQFKRAKTQNVSIESQIYSEYFPYLNAVHTIHDKETKDPILIIVNREEAIKRISARHGLADRDQIEEVVKNAAYRDRD